MATKNGGGKRESAGAGAGAADGEKPSEWEDVPEPIRIDGFWFQESGAVIEGGILEYEESAGQYPGGFFKVKVTRPVKIRQRDSDDGKKVPAGAIVGVNENSHTRVFHKKMKAGPLVVRITLGERRTDGKGFDTTVQVRPAF